MSYKCLDLFCGLGGWTLGFRKEGFEVLGIDIIDVGYPSFNILIKDVRDLHGEDFKDYDVIVGSPPCRDFSKLINSCSQFWKDPPNTERGLELVNNFLRIIEEAKPKIWIMENVPNLVEYISLKPKCIINLTWRGKKRALFGNFPSCIFPMLKPKLRHDDIKGKLRAWKRAIIPITISQTLAKACKEELDKCHTTGNMER